MKAVFKRARQKKDKKTDKPRPRSAKRTIAYALREGTGADKDPVLAVEGRAPGGGAIFGDAKLDAIAFASRAPVGKSEVGHYLLAAEGDPSPEVTAKLLRACHAWAEKYLDDDRGYLLVAHRQHVHVMPEMYGAAGRAFYVDDDLYMRMKMLEFTTEFEANDQTPKPDRPRRTFDLKAVNSRANVLALRLLAEEATPGKTTWQRLKDIKEISSGRVKGGEATSFDYKEEDGRLLRISVANVEAHMERERKRRVTAEAIATKAKAGQAAALGEQAKKMMSKGIGGMFEELEQVAQGDPTPVQAPRGRSK
jgi:hypothetical protein